MAFKTIDSDIKFKIADQQEMSVGKEQPLTSTEQEGIQLSPKSAFDNENLEFSGIQLEPKLQ